MSRNQTLQSGALSRAEQLIHQFQFSGFTKSKHYPSVDNVQFIKDLRARVETPADMDQKRRASVAPLFSSMCY